MKLLYLKDVATLKLDPVKCTGCGICLSVCPRDVLAIEERIAAMVDRDACMECGACAVNCPFEAITVRSGVGCAYGVMRGLLTGGEPNCSCGDGCC